MPIRHGPSTMAVYMRGVVCAPKPQPASCCCCMGPCGLTVVSFFVASPVGLTSVSSQLPGRALPRLVRNPVLCAAMVRFSDHPLGVRSAGVVHLDCLAIQIEEQGGMEKCFPETVRCKSFAPPLCISLVPVTDQK